LLDEGPMFPESLDKVSIKAWERLEHEIRVPIFDVERDISNSTEEGVDYDLKGLNEFKEIVWRLRVACVQEEAHIFPNDVYGRPSTSRFESPFEEKQKLWHSNEFKKMTTEVKAWIKYDFILSLTQLYIKQNFDCCWKLKLENEILDILAQKLKVTGEFYHSKYT